MKCEFCAGDLSIDNEKCPYCNAANPYYEAHRKDMKAFQKKYAKTEKEVIEKTNRFTSKMVCVMTATVLALLCLGAIIVNANMYNINYALGRSSNKRNAGKYAKLAEQYESDRDYLNLAAIMEDRYEYYSESPLNEYLEVGSAARDYAAIVKKTGQIINGGLNYTDPIDYAKQIANEYNSLYKVRDQYTPEKIASGERYAQSHYEFVLDVVDDAHLILKTYFGMDDEAIAAFEEATPGQRQVVLEEVLVEVKDYE